MTYRLSASFRPLRTALLACTALGIPAHAAPAPTGPVVIFSSVKPVATIVPGRPVKTSGGTLQFRLPGGAMVSLVGAADFTVSASGALELRSGSATVVNDGTSPVQLALPGGVTGNLGPRGSASLAANPAGGSGSVLGGTLTLAGNGSQRQFTTGSFWSSSAGKIAQQGAGKPVPVSDAGPPSAPAAAKANPAASPPAPSIRQADASQWLQAGFPAALAQQLSAAGANAEVIAAARRAEAFAANPTVAAFPTGDYAALAAYAAKAAQLGGAPAFNGAQADIIASYFQYLASGRSGSTFLAAYGQILSSYLDLLRAGTLPSSFSGATQAQLAAWIGYLGRTSGYGALSASNQTLLSAYLDFLKGGGTADGFAPALANLTAQYLDYVRAGNDPASFAKLTQAVLLQYLAIVQSGGIKTQLSAQNQAFVDAYIASLKANGDGLAFLAQQSSALNAYLAYLNAGGLPSQYTALDQATLRAYLQALINAGLLNLKLGQNAAFFQGYYSYLAGGGAADAYAQLPANVWTSYAAALNAYYAYLAGGGVPSRYATLTQAQILAYLQTLVASGTFTTLIGANATFFNAYYSYLASGGAPDSYAQLPSAPAAMPTPTPAPVPAAGFTRVASASGYNAQVLAAQLTPAASRVEGFFGASAIPVSFDSAGTPTSYASGSSLITVGSAGVVEQAGNQWVNIGRYVNGTLTIQGSPVTLGTNQGASYLVMQAPGAVPTSGTVDFTQLAATSPNYALGTAAAGSFAGQMRVAYGGTVKVALQGTITMPDATFTFGNANEYANVASSGQAFTPAALNFFIHEPMTGTGHGCTASCQLLISGALAGDAGQYAGISYFSNLDQSDRLFGTAIFGGPGTSLASSGNGALTGTGTGTTFTGSVGTVVPAASSVEYSIQSAGLYGVALAAGRLTYASDNTVQTFTQSNSSIAYTRNSASVIDTNSVDGVVGWARWGNGTVTYSGLSDTLSGGKYLQAAWGVPATNAPTSGLVTYALASASAPTRSDGTGGDGTFTGSLAVDFAALKLGIDSTVTVGSTSYQMATTGGTSAPSMVINTTGNAEFQPLWFSGTTATINSVTGSIRGLLAGPGAGYAALSYKLLGGGVSIIGAATFKASAPASGSNTGNSNTGGTSTGQFTSASAGGLSTQTTTGTGFTNFAILGRSSNASAGVTTDSSGLASIDYAASGTMARGTASVTDSGTAGSGVVSWARWTGGTVVVTGPVTGQQTYNAVNNGGFAHIWGTRATGLPGSGTVSYVMAGGTSPVLIDGSVQPGTLNSASMGVDFAAKKVGFDANLSLNGQTFALASSGGAAAPSVALDSFWGFSTPMTVNGTTSGGASGFLAGSGGTYAGLSYYFPTGGSAAVGAIGFRKGP